LLGRARTAGLAKVRADGRPHDAPIWIDLHGETPVFTKGECNVKGRNMARDPRVSLCVDEGDSPFHFVLIESPADLVFGDPDSSTGDAHRGALMGAEQADEYGRRNAVEGELLVRVAQRKILAYRDLAH
jgi:PPOX class probable F420-dependent enzyme